MNSESTNSINRRYSVKDTLTKYFPGDTITEMRASDADGVKENREDILPLALACADDMAIGHFLSEYFLVDTVLYDDYIAYFVKSRYGDEVFLSFMHFEDDLEFPLDPKYAYELINAWEQKGYKAQIMRNCVGIDNYPNSSRFRMVSHLSEDLGTDYLIPTLVNDKYIFVRASEPFWKHADALLFSAISSGLTSEYESIFAEDAVIARCHNRSAYDRANGKYEKTEPFVNGITAIKDYFDGKDNVFMAYVKKRKSIAYSSMLMSGNNKYIMFVGARNLLTQLVEEPLAGDEEFIPMPQEQMPSGEIMPDLVGVRALDIPTMHSYAIQLSFADCCVKNYYLANITEAELPELVTVDGYEFNLDVLNSVTLICDHHREGVEFSNGYYIPAHILYYHGATQLVTEKIPGTAFENETLKIEGVYRVPLHIRRRVFCDTYQPRPGEYYGTGYTLLDENGNRTTDYSAFRIDSRGMGSRELLCTRSESSSLVGYMRRDGSWLVPPIFDDGNDFEYGHCVEVKKGDKKYLFNELGEIIEFPYDIDFRNFSGDLCEFSTGKYEGTYTYPDEEYFDELSAGNWGFVDKYGKIVIEPQYVFTTGFRHYENRAFVAKDVGGKTLWGLIDEKGNEVIPCIYPNLGTHSGTAVNFQRTEHGDYGIMDFDGNIIMEPRYDSIYEYDEKHGLIAFFLDWSEGHHVGIARVSDGEIIIPAKYGYIGFEDNYIECEKEYWTDTETMCDYYDYEGNLLPHDSCKHSWKCEGGYGSWNSQHKCGAVDENNNIIVPFIFEDSSHIGYYQSGYVVTGTKRKFGLSTREGKVMLAEKYRDITIKDDFIIASYRNDANWDIIDELYLLDGTPVFTDTYRRVSIDGDKLTRETPLGLEHYRIVRN